MKTLELVCGDPQTVKAGASYSRFVIPFAYRKLAPDATGGGQSHDNTTPLYEYEPDSDAGSSDDRWRREYLTSETEAVLFKNTKWFRLHQVSSKDGAQSQSQSLKFPRDFTIRINEKEIAASLSAPRLILFECPTEELPGRSESSWDILRVGFLVVEVFFSDNQETAVTLDDLLKINELFRYFDRPFEEHFDKPELRHFIALDSFGLPTVASNQPLDDSKRFYRRWWNLVKGALIKEENKDPWKIECGTYQAEKETAAGNAEAENAKNTYPDNRAFVWTCAILPLGAEHLWRTLTKDYWKASHHGHWIKLLNVDYPFGNTREDVHRSTNFEREWAEKHTYHRWEELGTYYGFTPHSGAALAPRSSDPPIWQHFRQMYFDQVLLLLYVRLMLFRFSAKLGKISRNARSADGATETWVNDFQNLRWQFTLFTNLYQFPLLSNQQQGVELYSLARECMEIDDLFEEVQEQIHNSHDYLAQQQERKQTEEIARLTRETTLLTEEITFLTRVAAVVSVMLFTVALFAMPAFNESPWMRARSRKFITFLVWLGVSLFLVIIGLIGAWLWRNHLSKRDPKTQS